MKTSIERAFEVRINGIPLLPFLLMAIASIGFLCSGHLDKTGMPGAFALMWSVGLTFYVIGERMPIWREYVGGGLILVFLASASLVHLGWISQTDAAFMADSVIANRFLYFLLVMLVASSLLGVDRTTLIKSLTGYIPAILCGLAGAMAAGAAVGALVGIEPQRIVTHYALPIMGGGNAAGAIPMAEVYEDSTGRESGEYYSFAISVLTIANFIAIVAASILNQLGKSFPALTGNGRLMRSTESPSPESTSQRDAAPDEVTRGDSQGAIFFALALLLISMTLYAAVPTIHLFAWAIVVILLLNLADVLPRQLVASLQAVTAWALHLFLILVLMAVGLTTDLDEVLRALNPTNVIIAGAIVGGAVLGSGIAGWFFGFYPVEAAITAGLCMANRGGSGDIEVLGAARRMELYPYSQVSSRIGGGMVLLIAGYVFGLLL